MIPEVQITEWRQIVPWQNDAQVEQDLIISRALVDIFSDDLLSEKLAFRGGTALNKLFFIPPKRYSEDIDLVQLKGEPIGEVLKRIRANLDQWLGKPKWKLGEGRATLVYRFDSTGSPSLRMKLKIEINTREHFSVFPLESRNFKLESSWHSGEAKILTYRFEELLGTKFRALYQRRKGRDAFDLAMAFQEFQDLDVEAILKSFDTYIKFTSNSVSRAEYEENLFHKRSNKLFLNDLGPLLPMESQDFDLHRAIDVVEEKLFSGSQEILGRGLSLSFGLFE